MKIECRGRDREFYSIIHRSGIALPSEELRVRTVKQRDGTKFEVKRIGQLTFTVPKVFVFRDTFFFILGKRQSKLNFLNKWAGVYVQLTERQLRIYQSLADVEAENTVQRINLHALMVGWREMRMMMCIVCEHDLEKEL